MNPDAVIQREPVILNVNGQDVRFDLKVDEGGEFTGEVLGESSYEPSEELSSHHHTLTGTTPDGADVTATNIGLTYSLEPSNGDGYHRVLHAVSTVGEATVDGTSDFVASNDAVTIRFDICCAKHFEPLQVDQEITLLERDGWTVTAAALDDIEDRIEYVKSRKSPIRTITLCVTQEIPGAIEHHVAEAEEKLQRVLPLIGFVQGIGPNYVTAILDSVNGESPDTVDSGLRFTKLYSTHGAIGGAFRSDRLTWGNEFTRYLSEAYDNLTEHVREELKFRHGIGYYWDAINATRPIEGRFLSICSAIELLAKRYSDFYNQQGETADRIAYLVNELDVETADLAEFAATSDRAVSQEYFYSYSRQYLVHGDNNPSYNELISDMEAAKILLQRIIRNRLLDNENHDTYETLGSLQPEGTIDFE